MSDRSTILEPVAPELIMDLLEKAGIRQGEEVLITVEPGHLSIEKDPIAELWGSLATSTPVSPRDLIEEAMLAESELFNDGEA